MHNNIENRRYIAASAAALIGATILAAGCGASGSDLTAAPRPNAKASAVQTLAISAEPRGPKTAAYQAPASVKAGLTRITLANQASGEREADLIRVDGRHSAAEVTKVITAQGGAKIPAWIHAAGGVLGVALGTSRSSVQVLAPGEYFITDNTDPDSPVTPAAPRQFTVTGPASGATLPPAPAQINASEYRFSISGLRAGKNIVHVQNTGRELHHALFFGEAPGATGAQIKKFFTSDGHGKPPLDPAKMAGTTVLDAGTDQNIELDLKPGKYAVVCFLSDRAGGPPHVAKGMFTEVTVK